MRFSKNFNEIYERFKKFDEICEKFKRIDERIEKFDDIRKKFNESDKRVKKFEKKTEILGGILVRFSRNSMKLIIFSRD